LCSFSGVGGAHRDCGGEHEHGSGFARASELVA